jgi:glyoxylase-like metal-dependent hydrolase (beta-lactamase superfamily II)
MQGTTTITDRGPVKVHTYTAPAEGFDVNTHLIELPTQLIAVDAQYGLPYAREVVAYAQSLGKPIARVYVTHEHPDHFFGAGAFEAPVYALAGVKEIIEEQGDAQVAQNHAQFGDFVPTTATKPEHVVKPGKETIDGVSFEFGKVEDAESPVLLTIGLPAQGVLITQDLVYNNVHLWLVGQHLDDWAAAIERYKRLRYDIILPGHGAPGGTELYDQVLDYLAAAEPILKGASSGEELKTRLIECFPNYEGVALLDVQNIYLFSAS